ncbi:MAG: zinc-binding dehydrogenase, partial [Candidatus Poribacteria bacterium]|nr:zinc-binding dehydrogenase [Candidatus Poribacteria bacterium]
RWFAEYFVNRAEQTIPLPDGVFSNEILMSQPLGTVIWAARKLPNLIHANTVVLGQGPMGLLIDHVLSNMGAKTVIGIDGIDHRLSVAEKMRATHRLNPNKDDSVARVAELTDGRMADLVVEAVGHQTATLPQCFPHVRDGGTILAFGVPDDDIYPVPFRELFFRNLTLIGSVIPQMQRDFPLAMDWITQGRIDVSPLITHEFRFEEDQVNAAYEMFTSHSDGVIKPIIHFE